MTEGPKKRVYEVDRVPSYLSRSVILPVLIPVAAAIGAAFVIVNLSRVFLAVSADLAVFLAIGMSTLILIGASVIAVRPKLSSGAIIAVLTVFSLAVGTVGLVAAGAGERKIVKHGEENGEHQPDVKGTSTAAAAPKGAVVIRAKNLLFDRNAFNLTADKEAVVRLINDDIDLHNIAVYRDAQATDVIFRGETFGGPGQRDYTFTAPAAGRYLFRCDVHPSMQGTVTVS